MTLSAAIKKDNLTTLNKCLDADEENALTQASPEARVQLIKKMAVNKGYIETEEDDTPDIIINKLITTLLYKERRHGEHAPIYNEIVRYITWLDQSLANQDKLFFERYITQKETENGTFYGSYLSDDSDSESEMEFLNLSKNQQAELKNQANIYNENAQIQKIVYQRKTGDKKKGELKELTTGSELFDLHERTKIHYPQNTNHNKIVRDLNHLNLSLKRGQKIHEVLDELKNQHSDFTNFYVAQYRGITYLTTKWNQLSRRVHRNDQSEIGKAQYSASVLSASGVNFFRAYTQSTDPNRDNTLKNNGNLLREILLTMRTPRPYVYKGYTYTNLAYVLQNIYTQDYDGFHKLIKTHPVLQHLFLNAENPFISMGDTPYHAEKYAYGIKPYKGHEGFRLRPRWQRNGKAERPKSGIVYASLHPLTDFTSDGPLHLISLNRAAEIKLQDELLIIPERESCFPAYLPEKRVFYKQVAKYPSFKGNYKNTFLIKYGMTEEIYNKFKTKLKSAPPHTDAMRSFKKLLGEWLCSYHEVKMIDLARQEAAKKGGILIYRDVHGGFSLTPPIDSINRNCKDMTKEIKDPIKKKQQLRASLGDKKNTDLYLLTQQFDTMNLNIDFEDNGANAFTEGNAEINTALSLLMSTITNQYHLALTHFLQQTIFCKEINSRFNTGQLKNASLLHLAVLHNNFNAVHLLLAHAEIEPNTEAEETTEKNCLDNIFYEQITPLHLAVLCGHQEIASLLFDHEKIHNKKHLSYVLHKNLLSESILIEPNQNNPDDLGVVYVHKEAIAIQRYHKNTLMHLAASTNNPALIDWLLDKKFDINAQNTSHNTPLDFAVRNKKFSLAAHLIHKGANPDVFYLKSYLKDTLDKSIKEYVKEPSTHKKPKNLAQDQLELLMALKIHHSDYLKDEQDSDTQLGINP